MCDHEQKYILAVQIISAHWASDDDCCGVYAVRTYVCWHMCVVGEVILRTEEGLHSLHFEEHERLLSHIAGICNLPPPHTRTTFLNFFYFFFCTHCAASVHCTSKLIILHLKWLPLVL